MTYDTIRRQYAKNAAEMGSMLASGKYRGLTRQQLEDCHARATALSVADDATLRQHFSACRAQVSSELAAMLSGPNAS